jgi:hypothetical protein
LIAVDKISKVENVTEQISSELLKRMDNDTELLTYMATFLSEVVTQMDKMNEKLDAISGGNNEAPEDVVENETTDNL